MFRVRRGVMTRLFSCCLLVSIIIDREFVAPYRSVNRSDEIIKDFYRLSIMSVDFRLFVNNDLFNERAKYSGREFFKTVILVNKHHKIENFIVVFFRFRVIIVRRFFNLCLDSSFCAPYFVCFSVNPLSATAWKLLSTIIGKLQAVLLWYFTKISYVFH